MNGALSPLWLEVSAYFSWMILGRITTSSGKLDKKSLEPGKNCEPAEIWHTGSEFNAEQHITNPLESQACIFFTGVLPLKEGQTHIFGLRQATKAVVRSFCGLLRTRNTL